MHFVMLGVVFLPEALNQHCCPGPVQSAKQGVFLCSRPQHSTAQHSHTTPAHALANIVSGAAADFIIQRQCRERRGCPSSMVGILQCSQRSPAHGQKL
jgi:hypothetical protein